MTYLIGGRRSGNRSRDRGGVDWSFDTGATGREGRRPASVGLHHRGEQRRHAREVCRGLKERELIVGRATAV